MLNQSRPLTDTASSAATTDTDRAERKPPYAYINPLACAPSTRSGRPNLRAFDVRPDTIEAGKSSGFMAAVEYVLSIQQGRLVDKFQPIREALAIRDAEADLDEPNRYGAAIGFLSAVDRMLGEYAREFDCLPYAKESVALGEVAKQKAADKELKKRVFVERMRAAKKRKVARAHRLALV